MKTTILSIAVALSVLFAVNNKTFAKSKNVDNTTMLSGITNINQIEVHGNVELYVSSGMNDKVKVYDSYYNQNALVQEQNGVLRISSFKAEKLIVWVTVTDLRAITAYDNATIKSFGKFSGIEFSLNLNNNACASFDMDCYAANIVLNDSAKADIMGSAAQSYMVINHSATANTTSFKAEHHTQVRLIAAVANKHLDDELAIN